MTVSVATRVATFNGSGTTGPFTFNFRVLSSDDITVTHIDSSGTRTTYVETTNYTISLVSSGLSGGIITLVSALAVGETLVVEGETPLSQNNGFSNQGDFFPENHENAFDKLTLIVQEMDGDVGRALKLNPESAITELYLPTPSANEVLAWNSAADGIENSGVLSSQVATVAASISNVNTVAASISNVNTVAADIANVNAVGTDLLGDDDVGTVAADLSGSDNIGTVAAAISNVNTVATNIADVNTVATNIVDIQNAEENATLAGDYATKVDGYVTGTDNSAKSWAIGGTGDGDPSAGSAKAWATTAEDTTVDGSGYSALHWAAKAEAAVISLRYPFSATSGTASAYTIDFTPDLAFGDGTSIRVSMHLANNASPTLAIDGGTAYEIVAPGNRSLAAGELALNENYLFQYDTSISKWVVMGGLNGSTWRADRDANGYSISNLRGYKTGFKVDGELVSGTLTKRFYAHVDMRLHNIKVKASSTLTMVLSHNGSDNIGFGAGPSDNVSVTATLTEHAVNEDSNAYIDLSQGDYIEVTLSSLAAGVIDLLTLFDITENYV